MLLCFENIGEIAMLIRILLSSWFRKCTYFISWIINHILLSRWFINLSVLFILIFVAILSLEESIRMNSGTATPEWWSGLWQNFSTEVMGAIMTFVLFEIVVGGQQRRQEKKEAEINQYERDQLQAENQHKRDQLQAISELQRANTPEERQPILDRMKSMDLFRGAYLKNANLEGANLNGADLRDADLERSNLVGANLSSAYLKDANLMHANLRNANLVTANLNGVIATAAHLEEADMLGVELVGAFLDSAYLEGTRFADANLIGAEMARARLLNTQWKRIIGSTDFPSILPDGTKWTEDTDMTRFTDPYDMATRNKIDEIRKEMGLNRLFDW